MKTRTIDITPQGSRVTIIPIELHHSRSNVDGFCRKTYKDVVRRLLTEPDTYAVLPGDVTNDDRPSMRERQAIVHAEQERKTALTEADNDHRFILEKSICEELRPVRHKILAMLDGDHYRLYRNGFTSTQHICETLKMPGAYLGERMGFVVLKVHRRSSPRDFDTVVIHLRHGKGSAGSIGADINKLVAQSAGFRADLYIGGHTHRKWTHSLPFYFVNKMGEIEQRPVGWARAGNTLRSFVPGETTYPEAAELSPLPVGYPDVYLDFARDKSRNIYLSAIRGLN